MTANAGAAALLDELGLAARGGQGGATAGREPATGVAASLPRITPGPFAEVGGAALAIEVDGGGGAGGGSGDGGGGPTGMCMAGADVDAVGPSPATTQAEADLDPVAAAAATKAAAKLERIRAKNRR
jgi:hypothetical protein